jgi:AraC-like DNA-binding protein
MKKPVKSEADNSLVPMSDLVPRLVREVGLDYEEVLKRAGVRAALGGRLYVTAEQFFAIWRALDELGAPREFGFDLVASPNIHQLDVASIAALHSATLRDAFATLARYKRLTCPEIIEVRELSTEAKVFVSWAGVDGAAPEKLIDASFKWLLSLSSRGLGEPLNPLRVELVRHEQHAELLRRQFGCAVRFNSEADAIVLPIRSLDRSLVTQNADLVSTMMPGLEEALDKRSSPSTLSSRVKAVILKKMQGKRPAVDDIARELGLSGRTLQRRLEDEGTAYQKLLDEVRRETATRLLTSTALEPGEVGFILGFEELNSFTRAFQGWEGTTPSRWRKAQAQGAVRLTAN